MFSHFNLNGKYRCRERVVQRVEKLYHFFIQFIYLYIYYSIIDITYSHIYYNSSAPLYMGHIVASTQNGDNGNIQ